MSSSHVLTTSQVTTLASPVRGEIFEALTSLGEASIAQVATTIGRPPASLYYHFERLVTVGLLEPAGARSANTQVETLYRPVATRLRFDKKNRSSDYRQAMSRLVKMSLAQAQRQFDQAQERTSEDPTQLLRVNARLNLATQEEFRKRLSDLGEWLRSKDSPDGERYSVTALFSPTRG